MTVGLVEYLEDAIARVEAGDVNSPSGSWMAGLYGKAANIFEKEMRVFVSKLLAACGLKYPTDFEPLRTSSMYEKLTLGQLIVIVREVMKRDPLCSAKCMPSGWTPGAFSGAAESVNKVWVDTKHGDEVSAARLLERMRVMLALGKSLRACNKTSQA
jgi:hypothetical protein